jgi:hypothetical protein
MYGMVMGSTNWALFDLNVIDQLYYPPTAALTAAYKCDGDLYYGRYCEQGF